MTEPAPVILTLLRPVAPPGTTIVVDDLRLYGAAAGYPSLDTLTAAAAGAFPNAAIRVGLDSLVAETQAKVYKELTADEGFSLPAGNRFAT